VRIFYGWRPNLPDEGDNHLVELAIAGGAAAIVTRNIRDLSRPDLLFPDLASLSPDQFLALLP
jgi:predicted nucleic acid-binding protein